MANGGLYSTTLWKYFRCFVFISLLHINHISCAGTQPLTPYTSCCEEVDQAPYDDCYVPCGSVANSTLYPALLGVSMGYLLIRLKAKLRDAILFSPEKAYKECLDQQLLPSAYGINYDSLRIPVAPETHLAAWFIPVNKEFGSQYKIVPTIVHFRSADSNVTRDLDLIRVLHEEVRANLMIVSYRGSYLSDGTFSLKSVLADAEKVLLYMKLKMKLNIIYVYGSSFGAIPACYVAGQGYLFKVDGLILENPWYSEIEFWRSLIPFSSVFSRLINTISNRFDASKSLRNVSMPMLYIPTILGDEEIRVRKLYKESVPHMEVFDIAHFDKNSAANISSSTSDNEALLASTIKSPTESSPIKYSYGSESPSSVRHRFTPPEVIGDDEKKADDSSVKPAESAKAKDEPYNTIPNLDDVPAEESTDRRKRELWRCNAVAGAIKHFLHHSI